MITLKKAPDKDFIVLNLSDPQLGDGEWEYGQKNRAILEYTVKELVSRVQPNLITVSGDLAWAGHRKAYAALADFLDSFGIPWAPVWGNHDNQDGPDFINEMADAYLTHPLCVYEKGDPSMGNGNYVIAVEEDGQIVEGIIMMDSHDRMPYTDGEGKTSSEWAHLIPEQLDWYRRQIALLDDMDCTDTALIMHIPIYAYRTAFAEAFRADWEPAKVSVTDSEAGLCWNEGFQDSVGVCWEGIASYPADEGAFAVIAELGSTKTVIAGHDHVNNWIIDHNGVKLVYSLKAGAGCYWNAQLNGGTILRITHRGVEEIRHEYVDVSHLA